MDWQTREQPRQYVAEPTPRVHMYAVGDLLLPRGKLSPAELLEMTNTNFEIHLQRYLVAYLAPEEVAELESKLQALRKLSAEPQS